MQTNSRQDSATIYQFPVGGRAGLAKGSNSSDLVLPSGEDYVVTDAWYHQDAIRDAQATKQ